MRWLIGVVTVLFLTVVLVCPALSAEKEAPVDLRVQYIEFPPYYFTGSDGKPDGFLLKFVMEVLRKAGVRAEYESLPAKRVLSNLYSEEPIASPGWFRTPEREAFARFSRPIFENTQLRALLLKKNAGEFQGLDSLAAMVGDSRLRIGLAEGYSLGPQADAIVAGASPDAVRVVGGYSRMLLMLAEERFQYMVMSPDCIPTLIRMNHLNPEIFVTKPLSDVSVGNKRYIIYSRGVSDSLIRRIDQALASMKKTK